MIKSIYGLRINGAENTSASTATLLSLSLSLCFHFLSSLQFSSSDFVTISLPLSRFPAYLNPSFASQMLSQLHFLSQSSQPLPFPSISFHNNQTLSFRQNDIHNLSFSPSLNHRSVSLRTRIVPAMTSDSNLSTHAVTSNGFSEPDLDRFAEVGNKLADAAGEVIRKYFRKKFEILDKEDLSPVTIADRTAEEAMVSIIQENLPSHAVYGEEHGWRCKEKFADYVWVLDPIDGTKSFITGKPLFGTLIALLHKGKPILGIIDQPVLRERWIGISGKKTMLNGEEVSTRTCAKLSQAYLYTTSPHLFKGDAEEAFARVRSKVKVPLYGCDCYAYALLASGYVDTVIESGLQPYDFLALIPVIEGAGGVITDWRGHPLYWEASADSSPTTFNVVAAGDRQIHQEALDVLQRK